MTSCRVMYLKHIEMVIDGCQLHVGWVIGWMSVQHRYQFCNEDNSGKSCLSIGNAAIALSVAVVIMDGYNFFSVLMGILHVFPHVKIDLSCFFSLFSRSAVAPHDLHIKPFMFNRLRQTFFRGCSDSHPRQMSKNLQHSKHEYSKNFVSVFRHRK